ncbi:MAG: universal stress protein [Deltaproteobacteria bacterium]|nr:universal stress protein [Deltaproteobacteria bacterium]
MLHTTVDLASGAAGRFSTSPDDGRRTLYCRTCWRSVTPETKTLDVARREHAELIVIERRPRSALRRVLSRDLGERLATLAPCPVVMFRAQTAHRPPPPPQRRPPRRGTDRFTQPLLNARVDALRLWMAQRRAAAAEIVVSAGVQDAIFALAGSAARSESPRSSAGRVRSRLELELREHQRALGALGRGPRFEGAPSSAAWAPGTITPARPL